jgi:uncharacterized coiled-coil protein SlyX
MGVTYGLDEEENVLFPFRHFSWILLGVVLVTSLVQVHFVRVSASAHQKLVTLTKAVTEKKPQSRAPLEIETTLSEIQAQLRSVFSELKSVNEAQLKLAELRERPPLTPGGSPSKDQAAITKKTDNTVKSKNASGFNTEAKASSRRSSTPAPPKREFSPEPPEPSHPVYSMKLNMMGRVKATALNVRKRPFPHSLIVEKLENGHLVKVTEKRVSGPKMWYRIVTPTGRAGWVDHRYLKLEELDTNKMGV